MTVLQLQKPYCFRGCQFEHSGTDSLLEESIEHQPLVLAIYVRAVDAAVYGQYFDVLGCNALAGG